MTLIHLDSGPIYIDRDYFKKALAGETVVSDIIISRGSGKPKVTVASPIYNDSNKVVGVLGATILFTEI